MKKNIIITFVTAISMICLLSIFFLKQSDYSDYMVIANTGYAVASDQLVKQLLHENIEITDDTKESYEGLSFDSGVMLYEQRGKLYLGEDKLQIISSFPLFVNNGSAILCANGNILAVTEDYEFVETYQGLYISDGISFNEDMERAYREDFILAQLTNGLFVNTMEVSVMQSALTPKTIPINAIVSFHENEIRYASLENGSFVLHQIPSLTASSTLTVNEDTLSYYDFLEKLGLYAKAELREKEESMITRTPSIPVNEQAVVTEKPTSTPKPVENIPSDETPVTGSLNQPSHNTEKPKEDKTEEISNPTQKPTKIPSQKEDKEKEEALLPTFIPKQPLPALPAELPSLPELPEPVLAGGSDSSSAEPDVTEDEDEKDDNKEEPKKEWAKPTITLGDFYALVYTLKNASMEVTNPEYLHKSGIAVEVYKNDKLAMRKAYTGSSMIQISSLEPDTEYRVVVTMAYLDKYGAKQTEQITSQTLKTKSLSELPSLKLNWTNGEIYSNKIELLGLQIENATFSEAYVDMLTNLAKVDVNITKEGMSEPTTFTFSQTSISHLKKLEPMTFQTSEVLSSNTTYTYVFSFQDRFGNLLPTVGVTTGQATTCKKEPKAVIALVKNEVKNVQLSITLDNRDNVTMENISFVVCDRDQNPVSTTIRRTNGQGEFGEGEEGYEHPLNLSYEMIRFEDLLDFEVYTLYVYADYDLEDNKGMLLAREIGKTKVTTSSISTLGYAFFDVTTSEISSSSAKVSVGLNLERTDARLVSLLTDYDIRFMKKDGGATNGITVTYPVITDQDFLSEEEQQGYIPDMQTATDGTLSLTGLEVAYLRQENKTLTFQLSNLESITDYQIQIVPKVLLGSGERATFREITSYFEPNTFKTLKQTPVVCIDAAYPSINSISLYKIHIQDADGAILAYPVTMHVYDESGNDIYTYEFADTNEVESIHLNKLSLNQEYTFRFFVREYNHGYEQATYRKNYEIYYEPLAETMMPLVIKTGEAVSGSIEFYGLDTQKVVKEKEVEAGSFLSSTSSKQNGTYGTRYNTDYRKRRAVFRTTVDFGDGNYNAVSFGYSQTNTSDNSEFYLYLTDPDLNPGADCIATISAYQNTYSIDYCRWTKNVVFTDGVILRGEQTIYVVEVNDTNNIRMSYFYGCTFKTVKESSDTTFYANIRVDFNDIKQELGNHPFYTIKIYENNVLCDIRKHQFFNGSKEKTLMMYSMLNSENGTIVDQMQFRGEDGCSDVNFYYETKRNKTYRMVLSTTVMGYELELGQISFDTKNVVYAIRNENELRAINFAPDASYVAVNDITVSASVQNITSSVWFRGKLNFQGHTLTLSQYNGLFQYIGPSGVVENMVIQYVSDYGDISAKHTHYTIAQYNYGTIRNIYFKRNNGNYAQTYIDYSAGLVYMNRGGGVIENFVIEIEDDWYATYLMGGVAIYNAGIIRNGYVYGNSMCFVSREKMTDTQYVSSLRIGGIVAINRYSGIVENCYTLMDIHTRTYLDTNDCAGTIVGYNTGTIRNSFSSGNVYFDGKIKEAINPVFVTKSSTMSKYNNVYFYSEAGYISYTEVDRLNKLVMRDEVWYKNLFDNSLATRKSQYQLEYVSQGFYPHVVLSDHMPSQELLPLPAIQEEEKADILAVSVIEQGLDDAKAILTFYNPDGLSVESIEARFLNCEVISQYQEDDYYRVVIRVTQAEQTKYYSSYDITSFTLAYGYGNLTYTKYYNEGEYKKLGVEFYKPISTVEEWAEIKNDLKQNYRLYQDIDFSYRAAKTIAIVATNYGNDTTDLGFEGKLDGNGKTIRNLDVSEVGYVFGKLSGSISHLTVENLTIDQTVNNHHGFISRIMNMATVDDVHIIGANLTSVQYTGALFAVSPKGSITVTNCSIHNVNITASNKYNTTQYIGGIGGYVTNTIDIENCYVDGIKIDVSEAFDCLGVGGIAGLLKTGCTVKNIYLVNGSIYSNFKNTGGIAGSINHTDSNFDGYELSNLYIDINISSITDVLGGFIGYTNGANLIEQVNGLFLGNVYSLNQEFEYVGRYIGHKNYTTSIQTSKLFTYESSYLNGKINTNMEKDTEFTYLTREELCQMDTYKEDVLALGDDFAITEDTIVQGMLPKLYATTGGLLPYQTDHYITDNRVRVTNITATPYTTGEIYVVTIEVEHPENYTITGAGFDDNLQLANVADAVRIEQQTEEKTTLIYILNYKGYYDTYYLTKLLYYDENDISQTELEKTMTMDTMIPPQYLDIANAREWNEKMAPSAYGQKGYNIRLIGDLDFSSYGNNVIHNVIVNRLIGGNADAQNRIKIVNVTLNTNLPFISYAYGSINNITFENITMKKIKASYSAKTTYFGIVANHVSSLHEVDLKNIVLESYNVEYTAPICKSSGANYNVTMDGIYITPTTANTACGGLIARLGGTGKVYQVEAKNIVIDAINQYVGGIVGYQADGSYFKDISLENFYVYGTTNYAGGIAGYAWGTTYGYLSANIKVRNGVVLGNQYVGGIYGRGRLRNNVSSVGNECDGYSAVVEDVFVNASNNYCGGLMGYGDAYRECIVKNSDVYGIAYVGGVVGKGIASDAYCLDSNISTVYNRNEGSMTNDKYTACVERYISKYHTMAANASSDTERAFAEKTAGFLKTKRLDATLNKNTWSAEPTGTVNLYLGGIAGAAHSLNSCVVANCNIGAFRADMVGGMVGIGIRTSDLYQNYRYLASGCQDSYVYGAKEVGGIIGRLSQYSIYNCYSNATVVASESDAGGIIGSYVLADNVSLADTSRMYQLYFTGSVTAPTKVGGLVGSMSHELYLTNFGYVIAGSLTVTNNDGIINLIGNKVSSDTSMFTKVRIYEDMSITIGNQTRNTEEYFMAYPYQALMDDIETVSTEDLLKESTYTAIGFPSSTVSWTSRFFNYSGLANGYMPYVTKVAFNTWNSTKGVMIARYQEGVKVDNNGIPITDDAGHYVYKYSTYDGGIPVPGYVSTQNLPIQTMMFALQRPATMPTISAYSIAADKLNIEFSNEAPEVSFQIEANGTQIASAKITKRVYTMTYDYRSTLTITLSDGKEETTYTVSPEDVSRSIMVWDNEYFYITGNGVEGSRATIVDQFVHLYDGKALSASGNLYDTSSGMIVAHVGTMKLLDETEPLYSFDYNGYHIEVYQNYSTSNGLVREGKRLLVNDNCLYAISAALSIVPDAIVMGTMDQNQYMTALSLSGQITDMTTKKISMPKEFDNNQICEMTNNIGNSSNILLVRYDDGAVAGFHYITGEMLPIETKRANVTNDSILSFLHSKPNASSIGNFATSYQNLISFQTNLIESGWAQVNGISFVNGTAVSEDDMNKGVKIEDDTSGIVTEGGTAFSQGNTSESGSTNEVAGGDGNNDGDETTEGNRITSGNEVGNGSTSLTETSNESPDTDVSTNTSTEANTNPVGDSSVTLNEKMEENVSNTNTSASSNETRATEQEGIGENRSGETLTETITPSATTKDTSLENKEQNETDTSFGNTENSAIPSKETINQTDHFADITKEGLHMVDSPLFGNSSKEEVKLEEGFQTVTAEETQNAILQSEKANAITSQKKQKINYVAYYDVEQEAYVLYNEEELLKTPEEILQTMNEKVERSGHMIEQHTPFRAELSKKSNHNRNGILLLILTVSSIASLLIYLLYKRQKEETNLCD